jgi:FlaA1/EpsC-like NDP-sugar epimerase
MPLAHRGAGWWLLPGIDFISSSVALAVVAILSGAAVVPALPVAPLVLVVAYSFLGVYGGNPSKGGLSSADGVGWPVIRIVVAALLAWVASLMTSISAGEQLALWAGFVAIDTASRALISPYLQRLSRPERWVLVGDEATSERLRAYAPLSDFATVVGTVPPAEGEDAGSNGRVAALEVVERYHADRIVISSQHADDEGLLELVRAFKSIGVPVSLLPRPLDLLEAQAVTACPTTGPIVAAPATPRSASSSRR